MSRRVLFFVLCLCFTASASFAASYQHISTAELQQLIGQSEVRVVDARNPNAFNGWAMQQEERAGHIPTATNLAASWVEKELPRTLEVTHAKQLDKAKQIVIYGYSLSEAKIVADWLVETGIPAKKISLYKDSFLAWSNAGLALEKLADHTNIVPPQWVNEKLAKKEILVVEASWGVGKVYSMNHIPSAIHLNTDLLESEERYWNFLPVSEIQNNLRQIGITVDTPVVLYGEAGIDAARAAVAMRLAGMKDVRLLNGGLQAWKAAGLPVEKTPNELAPTKKFGNAAPATDLVIDMKTAKQFLHAEDAELVSIRTWDEYIGKITGYNYIKPKGRISGAVWGHAGKDSYNMDDFRNPDNTMRDYHEIEAFWKEWRITKDKKVSFYCGTGWRASEALLYAEAMGFKQASLYDDGWHIWSMDSSNPVESGTPAQ